MVKKVRRNVVFDDSSSDHYEEQYESNNNNNNNNHVNNTDEGECNESDDDLENIGVDDGYDEDFMGDENDRIMLNAMTEVEREKELFKRMERREALKARLVIEKRLKAAHNKEHIQQPLVRPKRNLVKPTQKSIDLIRARRMKRKIDTDKQSAANSENDAEEDNKKVSTKNVDRHHLTNKHIQKEKYIRGNFSGDDDSSSSGDEFKSSYNKKALTPVTTLEEFKKLRISRHKISFWIHQPFFENKIPGFLVRFAGTAGTPVSSQSNEKDDLKSDKSGYQIFEIVEIMKSNKPYKLDEFHTNKYLHVRRGDDERMIRIDFISNQPFTENEVQSYIEAVEKDEKPKPTIETVQKKQADMKYCINFRPTEKDIDHIVEQKSKFRKVPVNITAEKHRIFIKIENARQQNDMQLVNKLEDDVRRLDGQLEEIHEKRTKNLDKIRIINERNRKSNIAQLEKVLEDNSSTSWGNKKDTTEFVDNPFVRRRTNPVMLSDRMLRDNINNKLKRKALNDDKPNNTNNEPSSTDASSSKPQQNNITTKNTDLITNLITNTSSSTSRNPYDISKDLENLYDFELDISLDLPTQSNSKPSKSKTT